MELYPGIDQLLLMLLMCGLLASVSLARISPWLTENRIYNILYGLTAIATGIVFFHAPVTKLTLYTSIPFFIGSLLCLAGLFLAGIYTHRLLRPVPVNG